MEQHATADLLTMVDLPPLEEKPVPSGGGGNISCAEVHEGKDIRAIVTASLTRLQAWWSHAKVNPDLPYCVATAPRRLILVAVTVALLVVFICMLV